MRAFGIIAVSLLILALPLMAQAESPKMELFGGYLNSPTSIPL